MEGSVLISHRSKRRVSLAVLLIDDLTGMPVRGSNARAWIEGEKPPIKKNDGWKSFYEALPATFLGKIHKTEGVKIYISARGETFTKSACAFIIKL